MVQLQSVLGFPWSSHRKLMTSAPASSAMVAERIPQSGSYLDEASLDANLIVMLAALFCALICGLGINFMFKCARRGSSRGMMLDSSEELGNTGLTKGALKTLPIIVCTATSNPPAFLMDCPICLAEFADGEKLRLIPECSHSFHVDCIDKWFFSHSSCPVCRHCLDLHDENSDKTSTAHLSNRVTPLGNGTLERNSSRTLPFPSPHPLSEFESSLLHIGAS